MVTLLDDNDKKDLHEQIDKNSELVNELKGDLSEFIDTGEKTEEIAKSDTLQKNKYIIATVGSAFQLSAYNADSCYTEKAIDVSDYLGRTLKIQLNAFNSGGRRCFGFCDSENIVSALFYENSVIYNYNNASGYYELELLIRDTHFFFSYSRSVATDIIISVEKKTMYTKAEVDAHLDRIVYVSTTGSDNNEGSKQLPFATVNHALEMGASKILMVGGVYEQTIDLSKATKKDITIMPYAFDAKVVFTDADRVISSNQSNVDGFTYVKSVTTDKTFDSRNRWVYQDGYSNPKTLITDERRHPLQRGQEYRNLDTRIIKTFATTLEDALTDIETSAGKGSYKWYYDANNSTLYFATPTTVSAIYPLCYSTGVDLFKNATHDISLNIIGIETKYLRFNISNTNNTVVRDCKSANVFGGGAFSYDNCLSATFIRCEATYCCSGENGDGFNGHANNNNEPFAKQCTALLVDCWSHDNNDDGYSDHERAETTIIGGLYEVNNKAGITPSYGSHCTCYNVLSRDNYSGFYCCGDVEEDEGGKYTQLICYDCVAFSNQRGGYKSGFVVAGANNKMTLVNCKSIQNIYGYSAIAESNTIELIDCGALNNVTSVKNGSGTFDIKNTELVN